MARFLTVTRRVVNLVKTQLYSFRENIMDNRLTSWDSRWTENKIGWHQSDLNFALANHGSLLLPTQKRRILVPLCGKSLDLKWFYDEGHFVVGIEGVEKACHEFFDEHSLPHVIEHFPNGKLFKSEDARLMIYCCDLFKLNAATLGKFDAVYDRGSLVAIDEEDRESYAKLMKSVLEPDFRYLASLVQYKPTAEFSGPPRNIPTELVQQLYGDLCQLKVLETVDLSQDDKVKNNWKLDVMDEVVVILTPKQ